MMQETAMNDYIKSVFGVGAGASFNICSAPSLVYLKMRSKLTKAQS